MDNNLDNQLKSLISKKLRQLRENSKETLEKTADFLDLNYSQYYRLWQGTQLPHLATLVKINRAYGLDMNWWFEDFIPPAEISRDINKKAMEKELLVNFNKLDPRSKKILQKILKNMLSKVNGRLPVNNIYFL